MIRVSIRANGVPRDVTALPTQKIEDFLENNGVDIVRTAVYLNGQALNPGTARKTFAEAGITDDAYFSANPKTGNG